MAAIYDALGNYMGDDGSPALGALMQPPPVAPPAGTAPLAGTAALSAPVAPAMPQMPQPALEQPTDVMGYGLPEGVLGPSSYAEPVMGEGVLMAASAPEGVLMQPQQDSGIFSFLNKPGASDSLVAFGSAMLRAPTFGEGLANAADAVTTVAQQYREPTPREISLAQLKGRMARAASGQSGYRPGQAGYADGRYIASRFNEQTGLTEYQMPDGSITTTMPEGFTDRVAANVGEENTFDSKAYNADWTTLQAVKKNINQYDTMISLAPNVNAGGDVVNRLKRSVNAFLGTDFGADLSDTQYFEKLNNDAQLEVAQGQKGLGQFTEMERQIVARSLPNVDTREATIIQVAARLKVQAQIKDEMITNWAAMPPEDKRRYGGYRSYVASTLKDYQNQYESRYEQEIASIAAGRGQGTPQKSGAASGNPTIFDEADAIVNGN